MYEYLFFDLDGTLTDPAKGITNSFIYALKYFGLEIPSYETLCSFIGPPLITTFKEYLHFSDEKAEEGVKVYREYFGKTGLFENSVYEGIEGLLQELKAKGKHLVVATSKPEHFSVRIMEHFNLAQYFDFICGSNVDESRSEKDEVIAYALKCCHLSTLEDKAKVLMIGDRKHDIIGAQKNGIKSCGVLFGYGTKEELQSHGADYIAETIEELKTIALS